MASFERMLNRLPSLYRPEPTDSTLVTFLLRTVAAQLDATDAQMSQIMQAHWFAYADRALYQPYFLRSRELLDQPRPKLSNRADRTAIDDFPYLHDLARLGALLSLSPWREPPYLRENVEQYRLRLARMVALYRNGLGTVNALRSMVEAQLPVNLDALPGQADRPFWLEEFAPLVQRTTAVTQPGAPIDMVGPLMRWTLENDGIAPAPLTLYMQGVTPQAGLIDATETPLVELYQSGAHMPRIGIAFRGTLDPDVTLRLRPAFMSWLGGAAGPLLATTAPSADLPADPTAPGPWQAPEDLPPGLAAATVVALLQSEDQMLWFAANNADESGALWRYDGQTWMEAVSGLPRIHALADEGQALLLGTATGLQRITRAPDGVTYAANPIPEVSGQPLYAILQTQDGLWWFGAEDGLTQRRDQSDGAQIYAPFVLHSAAGNEVAVYAITQDQTAAGQGTLYFGTALGVFLWQPGTGHWYWYAGDARSDQQPDWQRFTPGAAAGERNFPTANQVFLPQVRALYRDDDGTLWLGTPQGIARYVAHAVSDFTYTTQLEAFPDLLVGDVFSITEDARGVRWFCTARGLFRYDGRDWWQFQSAAGAWTQLGRADTLYQEPPAERGAWRFDRSQAQWQRLDPVAALWNNFTEEPRSTEEEPVYTVGWADHVVADMGAWDGANFTKTGDVHGANLVMRYKIDETRVVDGGLPALPRLPVGSSTWRYLALEPEEFVEPAARPAWTREGRLLPPPPERSAPPPGRYSLPLPPPASNFDEAVFAFRPAARLWFAWEAQRALTVLVRLKKQKVDEQIDPAILDRVWQGMQQVRPAGVRTVLAVEEEIVRVEQ
ncbi:MAG: two-component regulator propeller domain-containing protein [Caldilineaceae bacterium]